ncbi:MAG: hypothetical protein AAF205_12265 [Pseudomonadota bacterium]
MTEEEVSELRVTAQRASSFATVALFVAVIALALAIFGLFVPLSFPR